MARFTAKNKHSEETIRKLSVAQYNVFGIGKKLKILFMGILVMSVAIFTKPGEMGFALLMLLGGWLIMSTSLPRKRQEDKLLEKMGGKYPSSRYFFEDKEIIICTGGATWEIPYNKVIAAVKDTEYYYLFISHMSAYMFPKESVKPGNGLDRFIEEKTGLIFIKPCSILQLSFKEIGLRIKNLNRLRQRRHTRH